MYNSIAEILQNKETLPYLSESSLIDNHAYIIVARNAYVGVWDAFQHAFLIARFKFSTTPCIFEEYHWDFDQKIGTAKPLAHIEEVPHEILFDNIKLLNYLCELERKHPLIEGVDTVE